MLSHSIRNLMFEIKVSAGLAPNPLSKRLFRDTQHLVAVVTFSIPGLIRRALQCRPLSLHCSSALLFNSMGHCVRVCPTQCDLLLTCFPLQISHYQTKSHSNLNVRPVSRALFFFLSLWQGIGQNHHLPSVAESSGSADSRSSFTGRQPNMWQKNSDADGLPLSCLCANSSVARVVPKVETTSSCIFPKLDDDEMKGNGLFWLLFLQMRTKVGLWGEIANIFFYDFYLFEQWAWKQEQNC